MRARFYSPAWHRFLNSDRGIDSASWNQFSYTDGSPFHATDPSGLMRRFAGEATVPVYGRMPSSRPSGDLARGGFGQSSGPGAGAGARPRGPSLAGSRALHPRAADPGSAAGKAAEEVSEGKYADAFRRIKHQAALDTYRSEVKQAVDRWLEQGSLMGDFKALWDAPSSQPTIISAGSWTTSAVDTGLTRMGLKGISASGNAFILGFTSLWSFMDSLTALENHSITINNQLKQNLDKAASNYWEALNAN
jgi:hypothetical protein